MRGDSGASPILATMDTGQSTERGQNKNKCADENHQKKPQSVTLPSYINVKLPVIQSTGCERTVPVERSAPGTGRDDPWF